MSLLSRLMRQTRATRRPQATLYEIFLRGHGGTLAKWHHYFDIYERFFAPYRGKPVRMLEIGVLRGGSLRMWREYFGPDAMIAGADIDPATAAYAREGFRMFVGDQADPVFLKKVADELGEVDIVLDDGGHKMSQQVSSFEALYGLAKHLYVVEDTHTSYEAAFQDRPEGTFMDFAKAKVDSLHEWYASPAGHLLYKEPPATRRHEVDVSAFCAGTRGVYFFDSVVVFEKGPTAPRWSDIR